MNPKTSKGMFKVVHTSHINRTEASALYSLSPPIDPDISTNTVTALFRVLFLILFLNTRSPNALEGKHTLERRD